MLDFTGPIAEPPFSNATFEYAKELLCVDMENMVDMYGLTTRSELERLSAFIGGSNKREFFLLAVAFGRLFYVIEGAINGSEEGITDE